MHLIKDESGQVTGHTHGDEHCHRHVHEDGAEHSHEHSHEHEHGHMHSHEHADGCGCKEHEHGHKHSHQHTGDCDCKEHEHGHHHGHDHCCGGEKSCEGGCKDETTALLSYMVAHNSQHAQELDQMAANLRKLGMEEAAKTIEEGVGDFQKGNLRLSLALTLVKEQQKEA